jgi:hypothetical protein
VQVLAEIRSDILQAEFKALHDSYSRAKLLGEFKLNDSRSGIKQQSSSNQAAIKQQRETAQVLSKRAKFVEINLKVLGQVDEENPPTLELLNELFIVSLAQSPVHIPHIPHTPQTQSPS